MRLKNGFTLIELLIATTILVLAISLTTQVFSAARLSSKKASDHVAELSLVPLAMNVVRHQLRKGSRLSEHEGQLYLNGVHLNWHAKLQRKARSALTEDPDTGAPIVKAENLYLYDVELRFGQGGPDKVLSYQEFGWPSK